MTSWIEPPPKRKGMGCFGKGCLLIVILLVLLAAAFFIGVYTGTKPVEIPQVETSEDEQNAVRERWNEFEAASRNEPDLSPPVSTVPPAPEEAPTPDVAPSPVPSPPSANRIELTANDINQLIAGSRRARGKAFVSIDNNVARVRISVPLDKVGFAGRSLNGEFAVTPSADRSPRNLQVSQVSMSGLPDGMVGSLLGSRSVQSYVDEFAGEHGITSFTIENNKVILETTSRR
jgi:hypothetical protein